ncbi:outer membrane protein [Fodinibius sediminis]|uniref:Outer membrane protein beta-barrel domain-containing protein n=1 Tax=Fodinibius sediminis TaxID=1214077 RepID=A0A521DCB9_9BACT|nr:hypothetical protein [Fodinibius sediminis]SMO68560.1 hypothetical protein SAMN06265218_10973 [Fodinibius sediminis]
MKKIIVTSCVLFGLLFAFNSSSYAQESSPLSIGGGIKYGSEVEAIGIQAGAQYAFTPEISGHADFSIFFPENYDWWALNINGHYNFLADEDMKVYGLAGLNYATLNISYDLGEFGSGSVSSSELGLNLGGGAEFGMDFANIFTELKYVLGNADQLALSAGLRFGI